MFAPNPVHNITPLEDEKSILQDTTDRSCVGGEWRNVHIYEEKLLSYHACHTIPSEKSTQRLFANHTIGLGTGGIGKENDRNLRFSTPTVVGIIGLLRTWLSKKLQLLEPGLVQASKPD